MTEQIQPITRENTRSSDSSTDQSIQDFHDGQSSATNPTNSELSSSNLASPRPRSSTGPHVRRRKVPDSVTPNACTNCKKARAKCNGIKPACKRCNDRRVADTCHYEIHAKTAKEQMIREIQRLQRKTEHLEEEKDELGEKNEWIEQIMCSLKNDGQDNDIINRLKRGESHKRIAEWLGRPLVGGGGGGGEGSAQALSPTTERNISVAIEHYHRELVDNQDPRFWTSVTKDAALIEHLINLYLTWIHPVHMLFDENHFMESFRACADIYCSPSLVNVICAMSCHLLHGLWADDDQTNSGIDALCNSFLMEAQALMKTADITKMTVIQTYAIMFLVELGSGHGLKAASHLRLAAESLIAKQSSEQSLESEEVSAWGILTLHTAWSCFTYQKPSAPISTHAKPFSHIDLGHQTVGAWRFYRQPGDGDIAARPGFSLLAASEHAKLLRILHETILVYCGSHGKVSAKALLELYDRHLDWKENLPPKLEIKGSDPLPHAFFLHIQYACGMAQLLQPLLHLGHYRQSSYKRLQQLVVTHAKIGVDLLVQYRNLYSNQYLSPLHLLCMVHLCDSLVRYGSNDIDTSDVASFCLTSLEQAKVGYPLAGPLQKMFLSALNEYGIQISNEVERIVGTAVRIGPEELLDACSRTSYRQPIAQMLPNMNSDLGEEFMNGLQQIPDRPSPSQVTGRRPDADVMNRRSRMEVGSLLNP